MRIKLAGSGLLLAVSILAAGCVAVPVGPPVAVAPAPVIIAPQPYVVAPVYPVYPRYGYGYWRR